MKEKTSHIVVGIIFFVAIGILGYYTILLKDEIFAKRNQYSISAEFPNGNGLKKNDQVKVLGVYSGAVESVELNDNKVYVKMQMFNRFRMYENYLIKIKAEGFMGGRYVDIRPGVSYDENRMYREVSVKEPLIGAPSSDVMSALEDLLSDNKQAINETVTNMRDLSASFKQFSYKMNLIADRLNRGEGTLGKLLTEDKIANQTSDLLTQTKDTLEDAREQAPITSFIRAALLAF